MAHLILNSRRQGETLIRAGRVTVNGQVVSVLGAKVDPDTDRIRLDGAKGRVFKLDEEKRA